MPTSSGRGRVLRSPREIAKMRAAGLIVWQAHQAAAQLIQPGVTTATLNDAIRDVFRSANAVPLFLGYPGPTPFPAESCISVNEELVHGIPGPRELQEGDIVSIDIGCRFGGWCGDAAVTHPVGEVSSVARRLLHTTNHALNLAIELVGTKQKWSEVARELERFVNNAGFHVVESMVGHGIGQEMHEPPQIPNYYNRKWADEEDFDLRPGVVMAIEPMVNVGTKELICLRDGWTQIAADKKYAAHFEHTVALTLSGPRRLTGPPTDEELEALPAWLADKEKWKLW